MLENKIGHIYILKDPITNEIRYVGQTIAKPKRRLDQHIYQWKRSNGRITHVNSWIKSLAKNNYKPIMEIVISTENINDLDNLEIRYIALYKSLGCNLTNHTLGGCGNRGYKMSQESINKRIESCKKSEKWLEKSKKHSEIMKEKHKQGIYNFGYIHISEERRVAIGKKHSLKMKDYYDKHPDKKERIKNLVSIPVTAYYNNEVLYFKSAAEAARYFNLNDSTHITRVCKGKSKSGKTNGIKFEYTKK